MAEWVPKTAQIDFDVMLYKCGYAAQHMHYRIHPRDADGNISRDAIASFTYKKEADSYVDGKEEDYEVIPFTDVEPFDHAVHNVKELMAKIRQGIGAGRYNGYLTGKGNFREVMATIAPYKGNRDPSLKPYHYKDLKQYMIDRLGAIVVQGYEADDAMAMEHMKFYKPNQPYEEAESVIATTDKDLNMVPGWHFNFQSNTCYHIDDTTALRNFYEQLLTGDRNDNVIGIPRIGPVTARKMLAGVDDEWEMFNIVGKAYSAAYPELPLEEVVSRLRENGQLLWMWRKQDDIWVPPNER